MNIGLSERWEHALAAKSGSISTRMAWTAGARQLLSIGWSEAGILRLLERWHRPRSLATLARSLVPSGEETKSESAFFATLEARSEASDFTLKSWLKALEEMLAYADAKGRVYPIERLLGYLECAAEWLAQSDGARGLPEAVAEMLEEYGIAD